MKLIATQVTITKNHSISTLGSQMVACGSSLNEESDYGFPFFHVSCSFFLLVAFNMTIPFLGK